MGSGCSSSKGKVSEPVSPPSPPPEIDQDYGWLFNTFESYKSEETKYGRAALDNVGNTCAFNAVLQALIHTAPLADYFLAQVFEQELNLSNESGTNGELIRALYDIMRTVWTEHYEIIIPKTINKLFKKLSPSYRKAEQADAHEFFMFIYDFAHEDLKRLNKPMPETVQPVNSESAERTGSAVWKEETVLNDSVLADLFRGQLRSQVRCLKCGYVSVRFDPFNSLCLSTRFVECSLQDCLNDFTDVSTISEFACSSCNSMSEGMQKFDITKLPHILVITLKRYKTKKRKATKLEHLVNYPLTGLDMGKYMSNPVYEASYELYAKVDHTGSTKSGHYTASVRNRKNMKWYNFDDDKSEEAEEADLVGPDAYMLFYYNKSLEKYDRANPPAVASSYKRSSRPLKTDSIGQSIKVSTTTALEEMSPLKSSKVVPSMPDNYQGYAQDYPQYSLVNSSEANERRTPIGGHIASYINSFTVKAIEEASSIYTSAKLNRSPDIITRREDPNDFELSRFIPPSSYFGTSQQPSAARTRRNINSRTGDKRNTERYL